MAYTVPRGSRGTHTATIPSKKKTAPNRSQGSGTVTPRGKKGVSIRRKSVTNKKNVGQQVANSQLPPPDPYKNQIEALLKLRYGGEEAALRQKMTDIPQWFGQFQGRVAQAAQANAAYYNGLQQGNQQATMQAAQGPNLGQGVSADVQAQSQLAGASRASMQGAFGQAIGAAGGAENAFLQNQGVVGQAAQLGQQMGAQTAMQDLASQKAQYAVQARADLEKQAVQNELEREALGLKSQAETDKVGIAQQQSKDKAAQRKSTSRSQRAQRQATARENQANRSASAQQKAADRASREKIATARQKAAAKAKVKDPFPKKNSDKALDRLDTVTSDYHRFSSGNVEEDMGGGKKRTRKPTRDEVVARLRSEGFGANEIHLALTDEWGPDEIRMAHRLGIRVKDSHRKRAASKSQTRSSFNKSVNNSSGSDAAQR